MEQFTFSDIISHFTICSGCKKEACYIVKQERDSYPPLSEFFKPLSELKTHCYIKQFCAIDIHSHHITYSQNRSFLNLDVSGQYFRFQIRCKNCDWSLHFLSQDLYGRPTFLAPLRPQLFYIPVRDQNNSLWALIDVQYSDRKITYRMGVANTYQEDFEGGWPDISKLREKCKKMRIFG